LSVYSPVSQSVYIARCACEVFSGCRALDALRTFAERPRNKATVDSLSPRSPRPTPSTPGTSRRPERLVADAACCRFPTHGGPKNRLSFAVERGRSRKNGGGDHPIAFNNISCLQKLGIVAVQQPYRLSEPLVSVARNDCPILVQHNVDYSYTVYTHSKTCLEFQILFSRDFQPLLRSIMSTSSHQAKAIQALYNARGISETV
jgi:hypothetical protein